MGTCGSWGLLLVDVAARRGRWAPFLPARFPSAGAAGSPSQGTRRCSGRLVLHEAGGRLKRATLQCEFDCTRHATASMYSNSILVMIDSGLQPLWKAQKNWTHSLGQL